MDSGTGVAQAAPAKINLYLHVTGRRSDGYHLLDSLAVFASIHDTIVARENDSLALSLSGPFGSTLSAESDNLVLRAATLLRERGGVKAGAAITLVKRLPVASGIGGGSADAAATLLACDALWKTKAANPDLSAMALQLGADVPICLHGRAAFFGGIGEEIANAPKLPSAFLVLINPGIPLSTAEVFRARKGSFGNAGRFNDAAKDAAEFAQNPRNPAQRSQRSRNRAVPGVVASPRGSCRCQGLPALPHVGKRCQLLRIVRDRGRSDGRGACDRGTTAALVGYGQRADR